MEILRRNEVPFKNPGKGAEMRRYYELPHRGFRIVETLMPPGHVQNEHRHAELLDIMLVVEGEVAVTERTNDVLHEETLREGDMICFSPPSYHNVTNKSGAPARTFTLKMSGRTDRPAEEIAELFRTDWIGYGDR
jgi:quercetin dioxygenase-like cupin family protein